MTLSYYTLDMMELNRGFEHITEDAIKRSITEANDNHDIVAHTAFGAPIILCENRPRDNSFYGIKWIKFFVEA